MDGGLRMKFKVMLDENAKMPTKAHDTDAGFDLFSPKDFVVRCGSSAIVDTGARILIEKGYVGMVKSKSGLNMKGITCEGVVDAGYTGTIVVRLHSDKETIHFKKGQKIAQIVFLPIPEVELELTDSFEATERGENGFGSSGAF